MKKMTKGAIVTGLGVALLLGGGGTLAVWNADATSQPGSIVAGDLDLAAGEGQWRSNLSGSIQDISAYRVIPGETLTYSQDLDITLLGDEIKATLATDGVTPANGFVPADVNVSEPVLSTGSNVLTEENNGDTVTATTTFQFVDRPDQGRSSVGKTFAFGDVSYVLTQREPNALATSIN
ncbi:alternate-type signal peptide domain-containing protein [Citricoccus muralis]|uniref:Alternate signal-mediated exported protein n=1 Tax=Citricoccus muralis TaxID=169134 RepID=A0A3D9LBT5_9MICC|nr:alternate-type signal peptide domain-containing protein [Citricoccus muralis]REE03715.1 alternate signal-mediated exported protein [Citricoccus muralis]